MRYILFIGANFEQYLRLKEVLTEFTCACSIDLQDGIRQFNQQQFCLIVLELSLVLSHDAQEELLRSFRRAHPVPIIALSSNTDDSDIVRLLDAGADQILAVQTPIEVLAAYTRSLINRYILLDHLNQERPGTTDFHLGDFEINLMHRYVFLNGKKITLTHKEFDLLLFFAQNPEQVLTEDQIFEAVWHIDKEFHSSISKPINRLRQKIEPDHNNPSYIRSIHGVGYQFVPKLVESCDI